MSFQEN